MGIGDRGRRKVREALALLFGVWTSSIAIARSDGDTLRTVLLSVYDIQPPISLRLPRRFYSILVPFTGAASADDTSPRFGFVSHFFFFTVGALCLIPTKCKGFFKESLTPKEGQHLLRPFSYRLLYCHTWPISQ